MPQHGKHSTNVRGKTSILDQDEELAQFCLAEFMSGKNPTEISRLVSIRFPEKRIARISLSRWLDKQIDYIDPQTQDTNKIGAVVIDAFESTTESFNNLFEEIKENVLMDKKQIDQLEKVQRKINLNLNLARKKFKIFQLQLRISDTEIQSTLGEFCRLLTGPQKETLSRMVEGLFLDEQIIPDKDKKKYQCYQKKRVKEFYKCFPQPSTPEVQ